MMRFVFVSFVSLSSFVSLCSFLMPSLASAQRAEDRAALEIGFDHGLGELREPGEELTVVGATAHLDVRLHAPNGFGGMARVGTTFGRVLTVEASVGASYRAMLFREGPRGIELGGAIGPSLYYNAWAPRVGIASSLLAGGLAMLHVDYREHGFFVGLATDCRWLPIGGVQGGIDTFAYGLMLRVGGEVSL